MGPKPLFWALWLSTAYTALVFQTCSLHDLPSKSTWVEWGPGGKCVFKISIIRHGKLKWIIVALKVIFFNMIGLKEHGVKCMCECKASADRILSILQASNLS